MKTMLNFKTSKKPWVICAFALAFIFAGILALPNILGEPDQSRELVVKQKSEYVLLESDEISSDVEIMERALKNLTVSVDGEPVSFVLTNVAAANATFASDLDVRAVVSHYQNGSVNYDVIDEQSGESVHGFVKVVFTDELDANGSDEKDPSTGDATSHKGNVIEDEAHAAADREVEGVFNPVVDGYAAEVISGTEAGDAIIEADPYLEYSEDGSLDKQSENPQQEITVVEKPVSQPQSTPATPAPTPVVEQQPTSTPVVDDKTQIVIEEGSVEPPVVEQPVQPAQPEPTPVVEEQPAQESAPTNSITTAYGKLVVIDDQENAVGTYWGNGSERIVATVSEANVIDNGDGTVSTSFGIFNK